MSNNDALLPQMAVGIDVGSRNARVAVVSSLQGLKVVSNTCGQRSTLASVVKEDDHIVMGEAAHRLLVKQKKLAAVDQQYTVHYYIQSQKENDLVSSFMGHLASLASDATSLPPSQLRVVLSVPVDASEEFVESLLECTKQGIRTLIKQGNKKKKVKDTIVVGVVTDAAAVCVAHGLTDKNSDIPQKKNVLVVDWGASGLTLSSLEILGSSRILALKSTTRDESLSCHVLVEVFAKHVASQFEQKNKLPKDEVWQSFKARSKLTSACEAALKSMTTSSSSGGPTNGSSSGNSNSTVHVTIDGLFEGIDCHVGVSRPRWDMLTLPLLNKARVLLEGVAADDEKPSIVLLAGGIGLMPSVQQLLDKVFPEAHRGLSNISPDEAVALGCAHYASHAVDELLMAGSDRTPGMAVAPHISDILVSPIDLGLCKQDGSTTTLIKKGTPLPAHVTHTFTCESGDSIGLWQLTPTDKLVARLEELPCEEQVELLVELSTEGSLSMAVQGGALVSI